MKQIKFIYASLVVTVFVVTACTSNAPETAEASNEAISETADTTKEQLPKQADVHAIQCNGTVTVPQNARVAIHAKTNGIVRHISVTVGQSVRKGQVLARLEHQDIIELQEDFLDIRAKHTFLEKEYTRKKVLLNGKTISEREFESTEAEYNAANARYQSLLQQLQLIGLSEPQVVSKGISRSVAVVAESDGIISTIPVHEGSFVGQNSAMFELVNTTVKQLELSVFSGDIPQLRVGQRIQYRFAGDTTNYVTAIKWIGAATENGKHTLRVTSEPLEGNTENFVIGGQVFAQFEE